MVEAAVVVTLGVGEVLSVQGFVDSTHDAREHWPHGESPEAQVDLEGLVGYYLSVIIGIDGVALNFKVDLGHLPLVFEKEGENHRGVFVVLLESVEGDVLEDHSNVEVGVDESFLFCLFDCSFKGVLVVSEGVDRVVLLGQVLKGIDGCVPEAAESLIVPV